MKRRIDLALLHVQLPARGLFSSLLPFLQMGDPYGSIEMDTDEISEAIRVSRSRVRQALWELLKARILVTSSTGYRCPMLQEERENIAKREEIRVLVERCRREHVMSTVQAGGSGALRTSNGRH